MELNSKNKFEKLVQLFGFIIRIYHDARSTERQITPDVYAKHKWLSGCAEINTLLVIFISHAIPLALGLPKERPRSRHWKLLIIFTSGLLFIMLCSRLLFINLTDSSSQSNCSCNFQNYSSYLNSKIYLLYYSITSILSSTCRH